MRSLGLALARFYDESGAIYHCAEPVRKGAQAGEFKR
jgi:hypothetical protein